MISRKQFEDEQFPGRQRKSQIQMTFLKIIYENKDKAFTAEELAKQVYKTDDKYATAKSCAILKRLEKRGVVEKKAPYWAAVISESNNIPSSPL